MTVTDTLPAGVMFDSATPSQGSCSEASGTVTCALGTVANGGERERRDQGAPAGGRPDHEPGDRQLGPRRPGPGQQLRQRHHDGDTRRRPVADEVSDSPDPVLAGELLTYTAHGAQLRALERHRRGGHRHPAGGRDLRLGHALAGHLLRVERHGHLRAGHDRRRGQQASVEIKVRRRRPARSPTRRRCRVRGQRPGLLEQLRQRRDHRHPAADLSLTKTDSPDPVLEGQLLTYTLTAHNAGPQDATGVDAHRHAARRASPSTPPRPRRAAARESSGTVTCALGTIAERRERHRRDQGHAAGPGHDHQPGRASRPTLPTPIPRTRAPAPRRP